MPGTGRSAVARTALALPTGGSHALTRPRLCAPPLFLVANWRRRRFPQRRVRHQQQCRQPPHPSLWGTAVRPIDQHAAVASAGPAFVLSGTAFSQPRPAQKSRLLRQPCPRQQLLPPRLSATTPNVRATASKHLFWPYLLLAANSPSLPPLPPSLSLSLSLHVIGTHVLLSAKTDRLFSTVATTALAATARCAAPRGLVRRKRVSTRPLVRALSACFLSLSSLKPRSSSSSR
jgi:hypothetical protein